MGEIVAELLRVLIEGVVEIVAKVITATGRLVLAGRKPSGFTAFVVGLFVWVVSIALIAAAALMLTSQ